MEYLSNLKWQEELSRFGPEEQKVLLALSHPTFKWRTRERLLTATGLSDSELDSTLAALMRKGLVRPSFSKNRSVIYGLRERVD
jgi:hypothetical protein